MNRSLRSLVWLAVLGLAPLPALAAPLAVFEVRDVLDLAWPRTLVTYLIESGAAAAPAADNDSAALSVPDPASPARVRIPQTVKPAELRLLDAEGKEAAFQLWQVRTNAAGELVSARLSFFAELAAGGAFRYELHSGRPAASAETLKVEAAGDTVTLDNGLVAVRLPKLGRQEFAEPLAMGQSHPEMVAAYGAQVAKGVAPGPLQGVRLCDGRWVGGSYFWAEDLAAAPKVAAVDCQVTARGPLFVEATVRYAFTHGGWYQFTARVLAGDPAVRIDEQFDMGEPGGMWSFRLMVSLGAGWQPDTVWWMAPRLKEEDAGFLAKLEALSVKRAPLWSSRRLAFDAPYTKVFDVAVRYPWHPNAYFFGLVADKDLTAEALAAGRLPGLGVVPMHSGNWRGATDSSPHASPVSWIAGPLSRSWSLPLPEARGSRPSSRTCVARCGSAGRRPSSRARCPGTGSRGSPRRRRRRRPSRTVFPSRPFREGDSSSPRTPP
ncbi:MAG: hypothetical protein BWZ02_01539 [Lentisphaerae bacterium ADurb.BinA184]|nr:MAG: hypothetical protein BWZ02_01539 [Lentisphaerae bacterium ADurb.BinA184]